MTKGPTTPYYCEDGWKSSSRADCEVLFGFLVCLFLPRYWYRKLLNFPLPWINGCTTKHGAILSERNPETSWETPTHQAIEKIPTSESVAKTGTHSCHNPDPSTGLYNLERTCNSQLLPEEKGVWTVHLALQLSRLPSKEWVRRTPSSENHWACIHELHRIAEDKV